MLLNDTSLHSWLELVIMVVLPLLVGLITKMSTHPGLKAILLLASTAVTSFITEWYHATNDPHVAYSMSRALLNMVIGFVLAVAVHYGLLKPTGLTAAAQNTGVTDGPPRDAGLTSALVVIIVVIALFALFAGLAVHPLFFVLLLVLLLLLL